MRHLPSRSRRDAERLPGPSVRAAAEELRLALDEQRWDDVGALAENHFFALVLAAPDTLIDAWKRVPAAWIDEHPRRRLAVEWTRSFAASVEPGNDESAERDFTRWMLDTDSPDARDALRVHLMAIRGHLAAGRFTRANDAADDAERAISDTAVAQAGGDLLGFALLEVGLARLAVGDLTRAAGAFSEGWHEAALEPPHPIAPHLAAHCALVHALGEDYPGADEWIARDSTRRSTEGSGLALRLHQARALTDALIAVAGLDRSSAEAALGSTASTPRSGDLWWVGAHIDARIALLWADRGEAIRRLDAALDEHPSVTAPSSFAGATLRADLSDLHQSLADLERAQRILKPALAPRPERLVAISGARLLMSYGRTDDALALLDRVRADGLAAWPMSSREKVLRANIAHLARTSGRGPAIRAAAQHVIQTRALDAARDALPVVYDAITRQPGFAAPTDTARSVPPPLIALTPREKQALAALVTHRSVDEIAAALHISRNTAKTHLRSLYTKLGVSTRAGALEASAPFL